MHLRHFSHGPFEFYKSFFFNKLWGLAAGGVLCYTGVLGKYFY